MLSVDVQTQVAVGSQDPSPLALFSVELCLGGLLLVTYLLWVGLERLLRWADHLPTQPVGQVSDAADAGRAGATVESPEHQPRESEARR
jgi:hypothetical protein